MSALACFSLQLFSFCSACGSTQAQGIWASNSEVFKITLVMVWPLTRFFVKLPELAQQHGSLGHLYISERGFNLESIQLHAPDSI